MNYFLLFWRELFLFFHLQLTPSYIFLSNFSFSAEGNKAFQQLTFKAAVRSILPLDSVTTSAWDFFFLFKLIEIIWPALPTWMSHMHSEKLLDFTLQLPPNGPYYYTPNRDGLSPMGQSHQKWHLVAAMRKPAASTCSCSSINQWL